MGLGLRRKDTSISRYVTTYKSRGGLNLPYFCILFYSRFYEVGFFPAGGLGGGFVSPPRLSSTKMLLSMDVAARQVSDRLGGHLHSACIFSVDIL